MTNARHLKVFRAISIASGVDTAAGECAQPSRHSSQMLEHIGLDVFCGETAFGIA